MEKELTPTPALSIDTQGIVYALIGTVFFSLKPVLIKIAYQLGGDAVTIMSLRAASSLPFYLLILGWLLRDAGQRHKTLRYGWQAMLIGILGYYFASLFDILALESISAQLERLLLFMFPSFVVLISVLILKETPKAGTFLSILLGYLGIALIVAHDIQHLGDDIWLGSLYALVSAMIFATYLVLSKQVISQLGSQLFTSLGMTSAGIVILLHFQWSGAQLSTISLDLALLGIALGFFCTVLPSYLIAAAMARLTPSAVSLTSNIGPAMTAVFAITLLDESFTVYHLIGITLVVFAVIQVNRKPRAARTQLTSPAEETSTGQKKATSPAGPKTEA
ncbi:DMT family transporter [Photobacterium halotolerans]|uniref:DMT family transporter n=1 Tax=Photobacterium halotolerans TaxID=265726 RepID=UPI0003F8D97B|nr:DMT family transporter [Photobacterium halotolerans]